MGFWNYSKKHTTLFVGYDDFVVLYMYIIFEIADVKYSMNSCYSILI